jgi:enoyl-CoA hydratase
VVDTRLGYALSEGIARIAFDDGKANAMSLPFFDALGAALGRAESDGAAAVLLRGRAGFFSGGLDLKVLGSLPPEGLRELSKRFAETLLRVFTLPLPTAAALTGHAVAGGAALAFACDLRVATEGAFRLQLNEVAIGIPVPRWMALIAKSALPAERRTEALLHARAWSPIEALREGLVHAVGATPDETEALALERLRPLALLNRSAYAETKRRLRADAAARALAALREEQGGG